MVRTNCLTLPTQAKQQVIGIRHNLKRARFFENIFGAFIRSPAHSLIVVFVEDWSIGLHFT